MFVKDYGQKMKFFSEELSSEFLEAVNVSGRKTIIFECEFFALLCALVVWRDVLAHCNVVSHTDNDAVRDSFMSCHTTSRNGLPILDACLKIDFFLQSNTWVTRVPTKSNVSDEPSRLQFDHLVDAGGVRDNVDYLQMTHVQQSGNLEEGEASEQPAFPFRQNSCMQREGLQLAT